MKPTIHFVQFCCFAVLCASLIPGCRKSDETSENPGPPAVNQGVFHADTISNHLRFLGATKKSGKIPGGPGGANLKISFEDTLYLMDQVKGPIKFLHEDPSKNVAGAYVQVHHSFSGGTHTIIDASYYYDVPEVPEMKDSDSVSVILIGIDPGGVVPQGVPPAGSPAITITIIPYDKSHQPIAQTTRPVKIGKINGSGSCGLVLPPGDYWDWHLTLIEDPNGTGLLFYNDHDKVWGLLGQNIKGCCIDGISSYNINCASNTAAQRSLNFPTFFRYMEEYIKFFENGTFARFTKELHAIPEPEKSNFCGNGLGVVSRVQYNVSYEGNYTVNKLATPFKGDSLAIQMLTTSKSGGTGYGRSGGIIHQLDCRTLALIQPDREGGVRHEVSFFTRITDGKEGWYEMN